MKHLRFLLSVFIFFIGFQVTAQQNIAHPVVEDLWYKTAVIYNLDVKVFKDSDGDGYGDFKGLTEELNYLQALGVDVLWLAPFQPSPMRDDGYDVADYYGIDSMYGSPGDFAEFITQAHKLGIRVIMDLVLNHTSDEHPWFVQSKDTASKYHNWYLWDKQRPDDWNKGMGFPGVEKETWRYDDKAKAYYFHRFYHFEPDLNYSNEDVQTEAQHVMGYWLAQGLDGFRLDAVPFIVDLPRTSADKPQHIFELIPEFRKYVQWHKGNALLLGEANVLPNENKEYFGEHGEGMNMMFNFIGNQYMFFSLATGEVQPFVNAIQGTKESPAVSQWANFLRNHDEVDLGRLTEQQRQQVFQKFGPDTSMQLYGRGIRRRLAPMLNNNKKQLEMAYSLMFSLPGPPVIRYGDEIGMGDDQSLKERLAVRTPMQWSDTLNAGFTTAKKPFRPVINKGTYSYKNVNVADELRDSSSLLNWTKKIINLKKMCPEIGLGEWDILESGSSHVLAIRFNYKGTSLITLHNFSNQPQQVTLKADSTMHTLYNLLQQHDNYQQQNNQFIISLEGYGYKWLRLNNVVH